MAQTTTSGWPAVQASSYRPLIHGFLAAWQRVVASGVQFFTIGQSAIGGKDIIKSGGSFVSFFDKYAYTPYTDYVMGWSVEQKIGQFPYGMIMAQADIELDNTTKLFSPDYDPTIGSGILGNRPVKLSVGFNGEPLSQFVGFTEPPEANIQDRKVTLHCFDALDYINNFQLTTSGIGTTRSGMLVNNYAHQIIEQLLISAGFASNQYQIDQSLQQPIQFAPLTNRAAGDVIEALTEAEQAVFFVDENGIFKWWNRQHFATLSGVNQYNLDYTNMKKLDYDNTPVINDVTVKAKPRTLGAYGQIYDSTQAVRLEANQTTDVFVKFTDDDGEMPVITVDTPENGSPTPPSNASYWLANSQPDGSGSDQSANISVASTYLFGTIYRLTLQNATSTAIYLTRLVLYGRAATVAEVIDERVTNETSIEAYGRNPDNQGESMVIENDYIQDRTTAYTLAQTIVNEYGAPFRRFKSEYFGDPKLQLGDWGTVQLPDHGQNKLSIITGRKIKLGREGNLSQELQLEVREVRTYFTIGVSAIAGPDEISP